MIATDKL